MARRKVVLSLIFLVLSAIFISLFGSRGTVLGILLSYFAYYHYAYKRINIIKLAPVGFIFLVFSIVWGNIRQHGVFSIDSFNIADILYSISRDRQGAEILPSLVAALNENVIDFQYGFPLLNIFFAPIPRSIWENKPDIIDESGIIGYSLMGENYWGLPAGPYGWIFFNFGWLGIILLSVISGIIVAKIYYFFIINKQGGQWGLVFYSFVFTSIVSLFNTSSQIIFLFMLFLIFLIIAIDRFLDSIFKGKAKFG